MKLIKWIFASTFLCASTATFSSNVEGITVSHYEPLQRLSLQKDAFSGSAKPGAADAVTMRFDALGESFQIELEQNTRLFSAAARAALQTDVTLYRGRLAGKPDSWARITVIDGMPGGLIWDGARMYAIEAPGDSLVNTTEPIIYRFADTYIAPGAMSCGGEETSGRGDQVLQSLMGQLKNARPMNTKSKGPGAVSSINFGAVGDFEFTGAAGGNAAAEILARLNNVDGIFSLQLGVQLNVEFLETFPDAADPFSDTTAASALLNELTAYRLNTPSQRNQGLTHLFTGRELDSSTVGLAFTGELCEPQFGVGLTQGTHGQAFDSLIAAHEIGHNFGAPHDGVAGSVCEAEPQTFLMAAFINSNDQLSNCSIAEMQDDISLASCIMPLADVDIAILPTAQPEPVLLGNAATVSFDVRNLGTTLAESVEVEISLPDDFLFLSSGATSGSCTNGAGTVNCLLGDIVAGGSVTVIVTTMTTVAGVGVFTAIASAPDDASPGNNQDVAQVTVIPAVNLSINPPAAAQVNVDQSTAVVVVLENQSTLDATGVSLSISLDSGLRADSASWSIGTCTVAAQQVDCQADRFAGLSNSTVQLGVSGTATGQKNYTLTLSSTEADADPSDNSITAAITVNSVTGDAGGGSDDDDGGGGAAGPFMLWLLGWMMLMARRRVTFA